MDDSLRQPNRRTPVFFDLDAAPGSDAGAEILNGLKADPAWISPKFFYDPLGSRLFEAICELPEYYVTRVEAQIMREHGAEVAAIVGTGCVLIDLGAGNCEKAERLFDLLQPRQYVAIDISTDFLRYKLQCLQDKHPGLDVIGIGTDFSRRLELPAAVRKERRLFLYPGSSIGNFTPDQALAFLKRVRAQCGDNGMLLLGVDLVKDKATLEAAYDDTIGVTAAFNLSVLNHVNRLIGSDFNVRDWRHVALFNEKESRIEMHLEARRAVEVHLRNNELLRKFHAGERIHTENSYKYELSRVEKLLKEAGFGWVRGRSDGGFAVVVGKAIF